MFAAISTLGLLQPPGFAALYSNLGYAVLGKRSALACRSR
jgi:CubicO group peptidase (beta-lactamase class C family)